MKNRSHPSSAVLRLLAAVLSAALVFAVLGTYAWFASRRGIHTMTEVESPSLLDILGGNKTAITEIDLSGVDVSKAGTKYFVFCVKGNKGTKNYRIELSHTTNIDFTYAVYQSAESTTADGNVPFYYYDNGTAQTKYYTKGTQVSGSYINQVAATGIADSTQHEATYGAYSKNQVQDNAEPLYWLSDSIARRSDLASDNHFYDYYVLELSWSALTNVKETDLVYLMAETV
jgi:hypothetical protein